MQVTDADFTASVEGVKGVVLVDFWADWCAPCKILEPIVEEVADEYKDKNVRVLKLDTDANPETAQKFLIRSIPTLIIFKDGVPVKQLVGVQPKEVITSAIEEAQS